MTETTKPKPLVEVPKTFEGLRDALFDEINQLRTGDGDIHRARAVAQLAHRIIEASRLAFHVSVGKLNNKSPHLLDSKPS